MAQADWLRPKVGGRPVLVLHSPDEPGELSQWKYHDVSTINVVLHYYYYCTLLSLFVDNQLDTPVLLTVGLHGAETWTLLKEDSRRLQAFDMTCQRRILGIRWNDFITNRAVSDSTNLPSILSTVASRRHSFFGHIRRLPDRTTARMTLKLAVNTRSGDTPHHGWNRPAGRPRTTSVSYTHLTLPTILRV